MSTTSVEPATPMSYVPSRRTVLRAAAWTAPAVSVAVAVPAYAAASTPVTCADAHYEIQWGSHYDAQSRTAVARLVGNAGTGTLGSDALTMFVSSQFHGEIVAGSTRTNAGTYANLALSPGNVGGTGRKGLTIMQRAAVGEFSAPRSASRQEITLSFNRPVRDLQFRLSDIDANEEEPRIEWYWDNGRLRRREIPRGQYQDRVWLSGSPAGAKASMVAGSGTSGNPWRSTNTDVEHDPVSGVNGNVTVSYAGRPASMAYVLTYWNDQPGELTAQGLQGIFLTDLTFTASSCA